MEMDYVKAGKAAYEFHTTAEGYKANWDSLHQSAKQLWIHLVADAFAAGTK